MFAGIEVRSLTKRFGSFVAVDDISCRVAEGEDLCLSGAERSGRDHNHHDADDARSGLLADLAVLGAIISVLLVIRGYLFGKIQI
jgi:hypothetical protein